MKVPRYNLVHQLSQVDGVGHSEHGKLFPPFIEGWLHSVLTLTVLYHGLGPHDRPEIGVRLSNVPYAESVSAV